MNVSLRQPVDEATRRLARRLVRSSRFAALASLSPGAGDPLVSRVSVATAVEGDPIILVSELSAHTKALLSDARCSLLFGEPGPGDPLAHPRISVSGLAEVVDRDSRAGKALRRRFLDRHPAAALYADFGDFHFLAVKAIRANLNAGFARAYELEPSDFIDAPVDEDFQRGLMRARDHMNLDHGDAVDRLARHHLDHDREGWRIVTGDPAGFEVGCGDLLGRIEFLTRAASRSDLRKAYVDLLKAANPST